MVGELLVVGQQLEHRPRVAKVALGEVVLLRADDGRGHEVAVTWRGVLHEVAAEQLADERLEDHVRREDRLAPVVNGGEPLGGLAHALPHRVVVPRVQVGGAVEILELIGQGQVVEREILRGPDPVHAVHRDRVVVHVGGRATVRIGEQVQPDVHEVRGGEREDPVLHG